ncbi:lipolytic protein G-D-S-L family [Mucilaginibacter terrenus]|uniref:Lipolytic protein G-D-S-L family n=2 Tax=Mucilaginibacter terrenus TaxID=2482727 RepID=A0A3E2NJW7_9SPHI|nr:lipolytic protein G-D-S-L family [Mucilaginibacter terrenus]
MVMSGSKAQGKRVNIVFIGNSITYGAGLSNPSVEAPPAVAADWLRKQKGIDSVSFSNQGHSGYTTLDFLPGTPAFSAVEDAAKIFTSGQLVFSIKLGTNDSAVQGTHGAPVAPPDYRTNVKAITDRLLTDFPNAIVIYQHPVWYSPNTYNGAKYLQKGLSRLESYIPVMDNLAKEYNSRVFIGDKRAFKYFKANYLTDFQAEPGKQGSFYLHPNAKGAVALGQFWGKAIYKVLKQAGAK